MLKTLAARKRRAKEILKTLEELYPEPEAPLAHKDPYTLLIAVLLSAQCTDARVNQVTPGLFRLADTPEKMARVPVEKIREIIKPCGLSPKKSQAISDLSRILVEKHGSKVPGTLDELTALPGVGRKTAQVVLAQAFNKPAFPVDTHIHRMARRWGLSDGKSVDKTESHLREVFPEESWSKLHLQIIYYGREYSPARGFRKENSPLCAKFCKDE